MHFATLLPTLSLLSGLAFGQDVPVRGEVTYGNTSVVIHKPIEEVFDYVSVPANWIKLQMGTWKVHGLAGECDQCPTARTMRRGEHFMEYMRYPGQFDFVGEWEVTVSERPTKWGFISRRWFGQNPGTIIQVTYSLEKCNETSTLWKRNRVNTALENRG